MNEVTIILIWSHKINTNHSQTCVLIDTFSCWQEEGIAMLILSAHTYSFSFPGPDQEGFYSPVSKIGASGSTVSWLHVVSTIQTIICCFGDMDIPVCDPINR